MDLEQAAARKLRAQGRHLRAIANELGVSISSVSVWVRDIPVPVSAADPVRDRENPPPLELKRCGRCELDLPTSSFNRSGYGTQVWCRSCFSEYFKTRGALHRRQSAAAKVRRKKLAAALVSRYLSAHPCCDCGESDSSILEFDHLETKNAEMAVLRKDGFSVKALESEMELCEVVCVNCHRRRTERRSPSWRLQPTSLSVLLPGERRNMLFLLELLQSSSCVDCGLADIVVLDFDHVDEKTGNVPQIARRGVSLDRLKAEAGGCQIRCANCHRRRTLIQLAGRRQAA